ncbi:MAG: hypothetical protein ACE5JT_02620 [Nitrosopumilaceae archaeon]
MKEDGAKRACQLQNKRLFLRQKFQRTSVVGSINAQFVEKKVGYKEEGHLLKVFIDVFLSKNCLQII